MRDTPRTFVGPVVLRLQGPLGSDRADAVREAVATLDDVSLCSLDPAAGVLVLRARAAVDRGEVLSLLRGAGVGVQD